ncbi:aminoglycoside phosphotransferase family protein [Ponticaulis profundi]|uniref:Aminoglycoside phosphotransferase family protein n=1 Tax=Ponticaulis profundi TaxID=2665222 RepID=A0ABW1SAT3_9PROT
MSEREAARVAFLRRVGWGDAERISLGEDASTRRYERLKRGDNIAIFMDAPPAAEGKPCGPDATEHDRVLAGWNARTRLAACRVDAFVGVGQFLNKLNLSAPEVYVFDVEEGFAILEDLGDGIFARELEKGADERTLYLAAIDCLAEVHNQQAPTEVKAEEWVWPIQSYDRLAMSTGADLFPKWYPALDSTVKFNGSLARDFAEVSEALCEHLALLPQVFMLRDYHAENLVWLPERDGLAKVGILDFQDAVRGPAAWDIAMFVQDARRDVSPQVQMDVVRRYLDRTGMSETMFARDLAIAGAINALRILGVFARLITRDNKPRYGAFLQREWHHLLSCLRDPVLEDLYFVLSRAVPEMGRS